jgi:DNA-binding transcriptional LysR family regulator
MVDIRLLSTKVDWDKLRIFNHVAWSGSLTKASEKLALSQSAVSR